MLKLLFYIMIMKKFKSENPYFVIQIYPPDTESDENKRALRFDLTVSFPKTVT